MIARKLVRLSPVVLAVFMASPSKAQDASLGCKVLLCAAASNPDWTGIGYCVPVMNELFSILDHGGDWPVCGEANASGITYQPFEACPVGTVSVSKETTSRGASTLYADSAGAYCAKSLLQQTYEATARSINAKPYSITISPNGGSAFTFSFALGGR